ncbi:hypothetical protein SLEP1_g58251, partial [Rubroshorea leprosula]
LKIICPVKEPPFLFLSLVSLQSTAGCLALVSPTLGSTSSGLVVQFYNCFQQGGFSSYFSMDWVENINASRNTIVSGRGSSMGFSSCLVFVLEERIEVLLVGDGGRLGDHATLCMNHRG